MKRMSRDGVCRATWDGGKCDRRILARGLCRTHYEQDRKGVPLGPIRYQTRIPRASDACIAEVAGERCGRPVQAHRLCYVHLRQRNAGQAFHAPERSRRASFAEFIQWILDNASPDGECLRSHRRGTPQGYPTAYFRREHDRIGRWLLRWRDGEPEGRHMLHSCHHPWCIRLEHLRWGTPKQNSADMVLAGRHPGQRLSGADMEEIRRRIAAGERNAAIARAYAVDPSLISHIRAGRRGSVLAGG